MRKLPILFWCLFLILFGECAYIKQVNARLQAESKQYALQSIYSDIEIAYAQQKSEVALAPNLLRVIASKILMPPLEDIKNKQTQGFGQNLLAYGGMGMDGHPGVDWAIEEGTAVFAAHDGVVIEAYGEETDATDGNVGFGNRVRIRWVEGRFGYEIIVAHLLSVSVKVGDEVKTGDVIGFSGNTGFSTRPHLHFGIRKLFCASISTLADDCTVLNMDNGYLGYLNPLPFLK